MNDMSYARHLEEIQKLAGEVNRDHPDWSLDRRLGEAMRRSRGHMNPKMVREALIRTPPCPTSASNLTTKENG